MKALRRLPALETALAAVAILGLFILGILQARHAADASVDAYSTYEPKPAGLRAWSELLEREGIAVTRFERRSAFLDRSIDTLIVVDPPIFLNLNLSMGADGRSLAQWVRTGGRLVFLGAGPYAQALARIDGFKDEGGVKQRKHWKAFVSPALRKYGVRRVVPADAQRLGVDKRDVVWLADAKGPIVEYRKVGRGDAVEVGDASIVTNERIAKADHARLAYAIARPRKPHGVVAFYETIHGHVTAEHWWQIAPRPFTIAVPIVLGVVALALVGGAIRLGPPLQPPARREPTSAEFVESLAALYERGGATQKALSAAFTSTKAGIAATLGLPSDTPTGVLADRIDVAGDRRRFSELAGLAAQGKVSPADLVRGVALAQSLRKELASHVRPRH